jgi:hypothetical protein
MSLRWPTHALGVACPYFAVPSLDDGAWHHPARVWVCEDRLPDVLALLALACETQTPIMLTSPEGDYGFWPVPGSLRVSERHEGEALLLFQAKCFPQISNRLLASASSVATAQAFLGWACSSIG